ncbi:CPBP family intramembrane glutamic endopeptidase [Undibacterium sp. 5I1]|uniref:CPBP family intramembrane glutamic endopeptidase n=1 Tax=unclassified Undibacterium TaxID=2630295 RepID=UPI002AB5DC00|nr:MULTISPECIES: CPBP family intramembrane glutamic endopeptidase [unclassified Undibacterium]MDY7539607.1 CPBP family intramembrane glutamic endopeptidase [Undibacterium sp. 5I1]MEB0230442.1 CPBP family intramembrane metalloprotease [Undibacterium sp. 10I3]MEB0258496.1 CPBP family intramembrane metalloprotease [Undibacterium sp. 5I1]
MEKFKHRPVVYFVLLSFGLAWLVALPLWLHDGLKNPLATALLIMMMGVPAISAMVVSKISEPNVSLMESLGLSSWRPIGRTLKFCLLAIFISVAVSLGSLLIGSMFGVYQLDLQNLSGLKELLNAKFAGNEAALAKLPSLHTVALLLILQAIVAAPLNAIAALGEEIGWRGWLLTKLMPLGTVPALLISGVVWGLWHAPAILLGYNYGAIPGWHALICMSASCIAFGSVLSWIRLRSGSVWAAALGHGAFNASAGFIYAYGVAGQTLDMTQATVLGWTGWIFPVLLSIALFSFFPKKYGPTTQL